MDHSTEVQRQTISPHGVWNMKSPSASVKKGKAGMIEKTMQIHLFIVSLCHYVSSVQMLFNFVQGEDDQGPQLSCHTVGKHR